MTKLVAYPLAALLVAGVPRAAAAQSEPPPLPAPAAYAPASPSQPTPPPAPPIYHYEPREASMRSASNAIFLEVMGSGGLYSVNFDRMLDEHVAFRLGFSYFSFTDKTIAPDASTMVTAPFTAAWLPGTANHKAELGGGAALIVLSGPIGSDLIAKFASTSKGVSAYGTAIVGYRYTPVHGGFFFRAGFTPLFGPGGFLPWGGMSLGGLF